MPEQGRLSGLLSRACAQDDARAREAAFDELLRLLMIYIRAGMGPRLRDHRESVDVCQSLARSFVEDFEAGTLVFESEAALAGYVQRTVRSKLADLARHDTAAKRGGGRAGLELPGEGPADGCPGPASAAIAREALGAALQTLTDDEQTLLRLRAQGLAWEDIAGQLARTPEAVRQQFSRVQRRLNQQHSAPTDS